VQHRPTVVSKATDAKDSKTKPLKPESNFIYEMRKYMPGPHARFLEQVTRVANIREFVQEHSYDRELSLAYDACLAMLSAFRDTHIQMVSRYIIIKSREAKKDEAEKEEKKSKKINLAHRTKPVGEDGAKTKQDLKGTGGTSLIPFLRQARDETGEQAVETWTRRILSKKKGSISGNEPGVIDQGLAGVWTVDDGGLCYW
jgi:indoleamine 2,3-dioxygenase